MVKRAKLTLDQPEVVPEELRPSPKSRPRAKWRELQEAIALQRQTKKQANLGAVIVLAGLTIASLIIFKQKIF